MDQSESDSTLSLQVAPISKTLTKKRVKRHKYQTDNNSKKRKFDNSNDDNKEKKIKLNQKFGIVQSTIKKIFQQNKLLTHELFVLNKERDDYKQKYLDLLAVVRQFVHASDRMNTVNTVNTLPINTELNRSNSSHKKQENNEIDDTADRVNTDEKPFSFFPKKTVSKTTNTNTANHENGLDEEIETNNKNKHPKNVIPSKDDATWQNTHYFAVMCHFCDESFDNQNGYINHLKQHYYSSKFNGSWLHCEFEKCNTIATNKYAFIAHIAAVHTKREIYHCNVKQDGIKCNHSGSYAYDLVTHINNKHYDKELIVQSAKKYQCNQSDSQMDDDDYSWRDCHFICVDCKFCGKYFNDLDEYMIHLKDEFEKDTTKKWLKCNETGCNSMETYNEQSFVLHLVMHGYSNPFHCNVKSGGKECKYSSAQKANMTTHLKCVHNISFQTRKND